MSRLDLVDPAEIPERFDAEEKLPEEVRSHGKYRQQAPTHRSLRNNPELHEFFVNGFMTLWREGLTGLTPRETELVILTTARETDLPLEWNVHLSKASKFGVSEDELRAVFYREYHDLDDSDAVLAEYCAAFANKRVTDDLHDALSEHYDDDVVVGIMMVTGFYVFVCQLVDALGIRTAEPDEEFDHVSYESLTSATA